MGPRSRRSGPVHVRDAGKRGHNSLNFVRLVLASAVVVTHTAAIGGVGGQMPPWIGWVAYWAVNGFFAVSGFLIAGSRMNTPFGPFMWNRALRIFPAYWTVLLVVALVIAPLSTVVSGESYGITSAADYVLNNSMLLTNQWGIAGTLESVPLAGAWNGSLWTLFFEFWAYLLAGALLSFAVVRRHAAWWTGGLLVASLVAQALAIGPLGLASASWLSALRLAPFFLAGMLLYFVGDRVRLSLGLALAAGVLLYVLLRTGHVNTFGQLPFAYLLLCFAGRVPVRLGSRNDISYGVYIYAFPMQQCLALVGASVLGPWGFALASMAVTLPLAWLSWTLVERPAMRFRMSSRTGASDRVDALPAEPAAVAAVAAPASPAS